jgi:hypothetical protein
MAKDYRENHKENEESREEEAFFELKSMKNIGKMKKRLDFKNSHFHNPLIQRHSIEDQKENGHSNKKRLFFLIFPI